MYLDHLKHYIDCKLRYAAGRLQQQGRKNGSGLQNDGESGCSNNWNGHANAASEDGCSNNGNRQANAAWKELEKAEKAFLYECAQLEGQGKMPYLEYLLEQFGLNEFERHCVRLLFVYEMDTGCAQAAALLQDGWGYVTPYLAWLSFGKQFADEDANEGLDEEQLYFAFAENSTLGRFFLQLQEDDSVFCMRRLRLAKRMLDFACGNFMSDRFGQLLQHWDENKPLKPWIGRPDSQISSCLERVLQHGQAGQVFYVYGEAGSGRRFSIWHGCREKGLSCCLIRLDACMQELELLEASERRTWLDGLLRELILFHEIPVLLSEQKEAGAVARMFGQMGEFIKQAADICPAVFLCLLQKVDPKDEYPVTYIYKKPLTLLEGKEYWEAEGRNYPLAPQLDLGGMSNKFRLTPGMISSILAHAENARIQNKEAYLSSGRITEECYGLIAQQMGKKAVKVPAIYCMEDLILPKRQKQQLLDACGQIKYKHKIYEEWGFQEKVAYGRGVSMAFAGPPGTGKTMAAQVIAKELGMELYKVDLSCVVSKYVGETEKNLDEIFDQAEKSQVILLFDEADVLFGKRSEGKESTDKYSNMEAAFLLQKMEGYEGIAILATNLFHHFDEAFKRRLKIVVEFPLPDEADRKQLWKSMIPHQMPVGEIDFDYLAKQFELTGSNIRNILLHSAFLAAAKQKAVGMEEIIPAVKNEYAKNGKNLARGDVSEYYMFLE